MTQDTRTSDNENRLPTQDTMDEIDLMDILRRLWLKRWFILKITGIFLLLGLFIALFSPVKYTAHCTVIPQSGKEGSSGNLGGLAAMMGVNIGAGGTSETLSPSVYPQIVKSLPFTREIMKTPIKVEKSEEEEITLYDFYANEAYQPFNLIGNIKKYTIGLPGVLVSAIGGNNSKGSSHAPANDSTSIPILSKKEEWIYQTIQSSIQLNMNSKGGYIEMSYTFPEAEAAARITDQLRKTLEQYVTAFKSEKVEDNLAFVQQSFNDARDDFLEKQERLATFQDANRGLTTASARATEQRLRSEYDIAFTVYNELAKQLEQAKLTVKESKPVLTVIEPVVVPVQKSAPRRSMILATFTFLGVVFSIGWVFIKPFVSEIAQGVRQNK